MFVVDLVDVGVDHSPVEESVGEVKCKVFAHHAEKQSGGESLRVWNVVNPK